MSKKKFIKEWMTITGILAVVLTLCGGVGFGISELLFYDTKLAIAGIIILFLALTLFMTWAGQEDKTDKEVK